MSLVSCFHEVIRKYYKGHFSLQMIPNENCLHIVSEYVQYEDMQDV